MHDLVIKNARVADGLGNPLQSADVAVGDGRIVAVGTVASAARETVDADGLVLAPGVVDVHTHFDAQLTWDPTATPSPTLGVTTVVMGNCGFGIAPATPEARQTIARNLAEVEGMSIEALEAGVDWSFESFADYLAMLRRKGSYPNVGVFVGHSTVRTVVMGAEASERAATDDEIARMKALVTESMLNGAIGFASSVSHSHRGWGGVPMPSRLAEEKETRALIGVLGETGRGIYQQTIGPDSTVAFIEEMAAETGRPMIYSGLVYREAFPEHCPTMLADCVAAQQRGRRVNAQVSCQPISFDFSMDNAYPMQSLDSWAELRGAGTEQVARTIADPAFRNRFRDNVANPGPGKLFYGDWRQIEVTQTAKPENQTLEERTIDDIANERGVDPADLFFDLALQEDLATVFNGKVLNANEDKVEPLLKHEASVISMSDAGAHQTFLCDAGYALHLYGHWVRERGAFTLEEAIRQLTSWPAGLYGIADRGRLVPGAYADLILFDPDRIGVSRNRRVNDLPTGASRLTRDAFGLHGVWINGTRVADQNGYCEVKQAPGQVLDSFDN